VNPSRSPRITLVTSNGVGLGHLSREIAIAIAIGDRSEVTMFSFSRGLPIAAQFGIKGEFCPSHSSPWIPYRRWDKYVERRFGAFLSEVRPDVVLFDGVAPYLGVINALRRHPSISAGWLRRGMWLSGPTDGQLAKSNAFDFVIEPGDIASEADNGPTARLESIRVPPVSLLEVVPTLDRDEAAAALGLDPTRPALLFGLGSGQPGDVANAPRAALHAALRHNDWQVAVVSSPLADPGEDEDLAAEGVQLQGIYPLVRYLAAFDAAVSSAGYNSVHELIPAGIPTLLVPNPAARTDNQVARASYLADRQLALMAAANDVGEVERRVEALLGHARAGLMASLQHLEDDTLEGGGGAAAVAEFVTSGPPVGVRETGPDDWRQPGIQGHVKRALGPKGVDLVQRALGRAPPHQPKAIVSLHPRHGSKHLLVTDDVADITRSEKQPVEHMLEGATSSYRKARRHLIDEFYEAMS
jgi:hypothetical protein